MNKFKILSSLLFIYPLIGLDIICARHISLYCSFSQVFSTYVTEHFSHKALKCLYHSNKQKLRF